MEGGADGYLIKPVGAVELLASINALIRLWRAEQKMREAREEAEASEARYRHLVDGLKAIIWEADAGPLQFTFVSRRAEEMLGYPLEQWYAESDFWRKIIHPQDRDHALENRRMTIADRGDGDFEYRVIAADGRALWLRDMVYVVRDKAGRVERLQGVMIDVTKQKLDEAKQTRTEQLLRGSEERLRFAQRAANAGVWDWDMAANRITLSGEYYRVYGLDQTTLSYEQWLDSIFAEDREQADRCVREAVERRREIGFDFRIIHPETGVRWLHAAGQVFRDGEGRPARASGITLDLTERRQAEAERERMLWREQQLRRQAEEACRLKDEFLTTLSHELRMPLHLMLGNLRLLRTQRMSQAETASALETIERSAKTQKQIVSDLLEAAEMITGKFRLKVRRLNFASAIAAAMEAIRPAAEARQIQLKAALDAEIGALAGDPDRLRQVAWNLLSNAVKFTAPGGAVDVRLERRGGFAELSVADTGQGISAEFLPFVFDRFRQADGSTTRKHGGLGLGLAIVRHLIELHGGSVEAASAGAGKGATFTVRLPLAAESKETSEGDLSPIASDYRPPKNLPRLDDVRVLVVDEEAGERELLNAILTQCGAEVLMASGVEEALAVMEEWRVDLLVADTTMSGGEGYDLIRRLRQRNGANEGDPPALAITAHRRSEDHLRALAAGYQMNVAKPIEPAELVVSLASLAELLNHKQQPFA